MSNMNDCFLWYFTLFCISVCVCVNVRGKSERERERERERETERERIMYSEKYPIKKILLQHDFHWTEITRICKHFSYVYFG